MRFNGCHDVPSDFSDLMKWLHEVKFDGWRIQLHKHGDSTAAFTKNGHHHSSRVGWMLEALARLPVRSLIIDGELVACDDAGRPDFFALHFHTRSRLCVWAFDLLHHNERDLRELPTRKDRTKNRTTNRTKRKPPGLGAAFCPR